jgi:uncharacterized cupin superfamily protein
VSQGYFPFVRRRVADAHNRRMKRINLTTVELKVDDDEPEGYKGGYAKLHPLVGGETMAGGYFVLQTGQAVCPYHYESDEEWLLVLDGRPTVRHPDGEDVVEPGDLVCFPRGPAGAHKVSNDGEETARVLIVSTRNLPAVAVYPDSDKIGVFDDEAGYRIMVRREAGVDYWDGER